jgi:hypothetical protein
MISGFHRFNLKYREENQAGDNFEDSPIDRQRQARRFGAYPDCPVCGLMERASSQNLCTTTFKLDQNYKQT